MKLFRICSMKATIQSQHFFYLFKLTALCAHFLNHLTKLFNTHGDIRMQVKFFQYVV